jgi:rubrerythrin
MSVFCFPFSWLTNNRKLSDAELLRAILFVVAVEFESVKLYMQLAGSIDNKLAVYLFLDIADEKYIHTG